LTPFLQVTAVPLYEYQCNQCGYRFEKIQSFNAQPLTGCPKCQGVLFRPLAAPAFQFKGSGWYVNDYAAKPAASTGAEKKAAATAAPPCAATGTCPAGGCGN
jgi:putative FmdB family regulatory protein